MYPAGTDRYRSVMVWRGVPVNGTGKTTPHLPGECHWGLLQRQCLLSLGSTAEATSVSLLLCLYAHWHGNAFILHSRPQCKNTCCPRSPAVWKNQDSLIHSPQTCLQLNTCANCLGDMSGDGLPSQRTRRSSLMNFWRNGV